MRFRPNLPYAMAIFGPVSTAGCQFVLSLQLLHGVSAAEFGGFTFLMVASQFSIGLSSALLCAPLPALLAEQGRDTDGAVRPLFAGNVYLAGLVLGVLALVGAGVGVAPEASLLFALYGGMFLLRWFARAYAYAVGAQWRTVASDLTYSGVLFVGIVCVWLSGSASLVGAFAWLLAATILSFAPFGFEYARRQARLNGAADIAGYRAVWRRHSQWSLLGVVTTEATGNAHAYVVTLAAGPAAFALVAASALLARPITVAMNALTEFERAQMARALAQPGQAGRTPSLSLFRAALLVALALNAAAAAFLLGFFPRLVFPEAYALEALAIGAALWFAIAGVRVLRTPESALLQAAGEFRALSMASVYASGIALAAVIVLLGAGGPLLSVVGVLVGEAVFALFIWRQTARWRTARLQAAPVPSNP